MCGQMCESQWHDNRATFASIYLWFFHLHNWDDYVYKNTNDYAKISRKVLRIMYKEIASNYVVKRLNYKVCDSSIILGEATFF